MGPPNIGVVHCDQFYVWGKVDGIAKALFRRFLDFAETNRAPYIHGLLVNQKVSDHFEAMGKEEGLTPIVSERVELYGRRN
jgi:RecB family endonuclease NucS